MNRVGHSTGVSAMSDESLIAEFLLHVWVSYKHSAPNGAQGQDDS